MNAPIKISCSTDSRHLESPDLATNQPEVDEAKVDKAEAKKVEACKVEANEAETVNLTDKNANALKSATLNTYMQTSTADMDLSNRHSMPDLSSPANLSVFNTMKLACIADRAIILTQEYEVDKAVSYLKQLNTPIFILSGGSNVILPSKLHASVIQPNFKGIHLLHEDKDSVQVEVMGGENWHELVLSTIGKGWYGLENLALIPGLVGASPVQNIGAYGCQLEDLVTHVRAYHLPSQSWHNFTQQECQFSYRDSKFKRESGQWLISRVGFKLHKDAYLINAHYGDVANLALSKATSNQRTRVTAEDVMTAIIQIRQEKLPDPKHLPNCGSFFKNPIVKTSQFESLKKQYPAMVGYSVDAEYTKVAAGWLIDTSGLKGKGIAPILTHDKQALVLVNHSYGLTNNPANKSNTEQNQATQDDVLNTQLYIQNIVKNNFGIHLEREPVLLEGNL